jgi:adenylyltransferase/sulfurtransferase
MPTVTIPPPYRGPTGGEAEIVVEGASVLECIEAVEVRHPGFRAQILDSGGDLHRFVRLFLNGQPLEGAPLEAATRAEDELAVVAAIAGGV